MRVSPHISPPKNALPNREHCKQASDEHKLNEIIEGKQSGVMYHNYDGATKPATGHKNKIMVSNPEGRFPANIILECCCDELLDGGAVS